MKTKTIDLYYSYSAMEGYGYNRHYYNGNERMLCGFFVCVYCFEEKYPRPERIKVTISTEQFEGSIDGFWDGEKLNSSRFRTRHKIHKSAKEMIRSLNPWWKFWARNNVKFYWKVEEIK